MVSVGYIAYSVSALSFIANTGRVSSCADLTYADLFMCGHGRCAGIGRIAYPYGRVLWCRSAWCERGCTGLMCYMHGRVFEGNRLHGRGGIIGVVYM